MKRPLGSFIRAMLAVTIAGPALAQIAPAATTTVERFAGVSASGAKLNGYGVVSTVRISPGNYGVIFNRNITKCALMGTLGHSSGAGNVPAGVITITDGLNNPQSVYVQIRDLNGNWLDVDFMVHVVCTTTI